MERSEPFQFVFAFIGAGNMAYAITKGFVSKNICNPDQILIYNRSVGKYDNFKPLGVTICSDYEKQFASSRFIILSTKPAQINEALQKLRQLNINLTHSTIISLAAGVTSDYICKCLGQKIGVIRTMPSTPMLVGKGAMAVAMNDNVEKREFEYACRSFSGIAEISVLDEEQMNPVIAVNGSSPAYVYAFIRAMLQGAEKQGIAKEAALPLILQTIEGASEMVRTSKDSIDELIRKVCSPKGTTLAAMEVLNTQNFEQAVVDAMTACTNRANEITAELDRQA